MSDCPTPHKHVHKSQGAAEKALAALARDKDLGPDWNIYRCRCGNWHIGHQPGSLVRRIHAALRERR